MIGGALPMTVIDPFVAKLTTQLKPPGSGGKLVEVNDPP
jgi:hypothetical protein